MVIYYHKRNSWNKEHLCIFKICVLGLTEWKEAWSEVSLLPKTVHPTNSSVFPTAKSCSSHKEPKSKPTYRFPFYPLKPTFYSGLLCSYFKVCIRRRAPWGQYRCHFQCTGAHGSVTSTSWVSGLLAWTMQVRTKHNRTHLQDACHRDFVLKNRLSHFEVHVFWIHLFLQLSVLVYSFPPKLIKPNTQYCYIFLNINYALVKKYIFKKFR